MAVTSDAISYMTFIANRPKEIRTIPKQSSLTAMPTPAPLTADVILSGGGLVGQAFAVALAHHGLSCRVIDPVDQNAQSAPGVDGRVASIASGSWKMLETIGVAEGGLPDRADLGVGWPQTRRA